MVGSEAVYLQFLFSQVFLDLFSLLLVACQVSLIQRSIESFARDLGVLRGKMEEEIEGS